MDDILLMNRDLSEILDLPAPEKNYDKGIHYVSHDTVVKCVELRMSRIKISDIFRSGEKYISVSEIVRRLKLPPDIVNEVFKIYSPAKTFLKSDEFYAPLYIQSSRLQSQQKFRKLTKGDIILQPGTHIAHTDAFSEVSIHEYISTLKCPTIVSMKKMFFTPATAYKRPRLYLHLQRCERSLRGVSEEINKTEMLAIMFQVLFTLEFLHRNGIYHNDMHLKNILLDYFSDVDVDKINEEEYFYYKYKTPIQTFYWSIPKMRYCPKIADFGIASKWSVPMIISHDCLVSGIDGTVPNFPSNAYDPLCFIRSIMMHSSEHASLACALLSDILNKPKGESPAKFFNRYFNDNDRPFMSVLNTVIGEISPLDIMLSKTFSVFLTDEPKGVLFGELSS